MKLLTFNCCGSDAGRCLPVLSRHDADILVLSEVVEFRGLPSTRSVWSGPRIPSGRRRKGVGILVREGLRVEQLDDEASASHVVGEVHGQGPPISVLGLWARPPYRETVRKGITDAGERARVAPLVVAGDFNDNAYERWTRRAPNNFSTTRGVLEERHGLTSAYHSFFGESFARETRPTLHWRNDSRHPFHIDFVFVPRSWASSIERVEVDGSAAIAALSDHRPLIVDVPWPQSP